MESLFPQKPIDGTVHQPPSCILLPGTMCVRAYLRLKMYLFTWSFHPSHVPEDNLVIKCDFATYFCLCFYLLLTSNIDIFIDVEVS